MPRSVRVVPGGVCYHVINRSSGRARIFDSAGDYRYFIHAIQRTQEHLQLEIHAVCLMPNHFHFVVRPQADRDLGKWMQRLMTTHVRWHHARVNSYGPLWQGRYKAFPIQQDEHLLTVMRYVERNALRAGIANCAESWPWGSLNWRLGGRFQRLLAPSPIALPLNWASIVNAPQSATELDALRTCVNRERPFGCETWVRAAATDLRLDSSIARIGRPRKGTGNGG